MWTLYKKNRDRGNIVGWVFHPHQVTGNVFSSEHAFPSQFWIYLEHCPRGQEVIRPYRTSAPFLYEVASHGCHVKKRPFHSGHYINLTMIISMIHHFHIKAILANTTRQMNSLKGHFLTWQQFRKKLPWKKIMRGAHCSTVMSMCRCSDM